MSRYVIENLFGIQGLNIAWYGVIIGIGIVLGVLLAVHRCHKVGLHDSLVIDYLLVALPVSILCARAYYITFQWPYYREHLSEILQIWKGGLAIYGGILGAILTAILFCRRKKVSFFQFADVCVPSLLLGQAIGRFWIEGLRADSLYLLPGIRISQWVSAAIVIAGVFLLVRIRRSEVLKK